MRVCLYVCICAEGDEKALLLQQRIADANVIIIIV